MWRTCEKKKSQKLTNQWEKVTKSYKLVRKSHKLAKKCDKKWKLKWQNVIN